MNDTRRPNLHSFEHTATDTEEDYAARIADAVTALVKAHEAGVVRAVGIYTVVTDGAEQRFWGVTVCKDRQLDRFTVEIIGEQVRLRGAAAERRT